MEVDKSLGVCPVRIGGVWMCYDSKCIVFVDGDKSRDKCRVDQLRTNLEAGMEDVIHVLQLIWELHAQEQESVFLLVNAQNAFNKGHWTNMCWTI